MIARFLLLVMMLLTLAVPAAAEGDRTRLREALGWLIGTWDTTETLPDGKATGLATFAWTIDGQFLEEEYHNNRGYQGYGLIRWTASNGLYRMWWFDAEGNAEEYRSVWDGGDRRVLFLHTLSPDRPVSTREIYTRVSDREFHYVMEEDKGDGYVVKWELTARKR